MTTDLRTLRAELTEKLASCDDPAFNADELIRHFLGFQQKMDMITHQAPSQDIGTCLR